MIGNYDYGHGNEWVPVMKAEMETTLILICIAIILVWAIPMTIRLAKSYESVRFYRSFFTVIMIVGAVVSYFSIPIWGNPTLSTVLIAIDTIGGTAMCVIGEMLDDKVEREQERKARFRRQRQINKYMRERGIK